MLNFIEMAGSGVVAMLFLFRLVTVQVVQAAALTAESKDKRSIVRAVPGAQAAFGGRSRQHQRDACSCGTGQRCLTVPDRHSMEQGH